MVVRHHLSLLEDGIKDACPVAEMDVALAASHQIATTHPA